MFKQTYSNLSPPLFKYFTLHINIRATIPLKTKRHSLFRNIKSDRWETYVRTLAIVRWIQFYFRCINIRGSAKFYENIDLVGTFCKSGPFNVFHQHISRDVMFLWNSPKYLTSYWLVLFHTHRPASPQESVKKIHSGRIPANETVFIARTRWFSKCREKKRRKEFASQRFPKFWNTWL